MILLEELISDILLKKFSTFHGTQRFFTMFTNSLSWDPKICHLTAMKLQSGAIN
jgi:hypothetical protein